MPTPPPRFCHALVGTLLLPTMALAVVQPASLFQDHAVLQQGMPIPVWGSAKDGEMVTVTLGDQTVSTVALGGTWQVRLAPMPAGGPYDLFIRGENQLVYTDVWLGEVWVCGGQSNMERQLGLREGQKPIDNWQAEAASADYPQIRHFGVDQRLSTRPEERVGGQWVVCTPETAPDFTAVGFFFGRALHTTRGVPIGLIHSSWGGTPAEAWTSREGLLRLPELADSVAWLDAYSRDPEAAQQAYLERLEAWFETNDAGTTEQWQSPDLDSHGWSSLDVPAMWEDAGLPGYDGIGWYRHEIELPAEWVGRAVELHLGAIDDIDHTWVNGHLVGSTQVWDTPRVYTLPPGTLQAGRNVLAVRVLDTGGGGGLWGGTDTLRLVTTDGSGEELPLDGPWAFHATTALADAPPPPPAISGTPGTPSVLYNGMIAPLVPYAIRGVIWYQGESNAGNADGYQLIFPNLVADWRDAWGQGDFPFLYVQIAPHEGMPPEIREAQRRSLATIPNSAMAVTIDVGDATDIHPTNKRPVGERLALAARALAYGETLAYSGPLYQAADFADGRAVIHFSHLGGGLVAKENRLEGFSIAGADGVFYAARAEIVGDTVEVQADAVPTPRAVRYAWAHVAHGTLYNQAGLPASPFTTDAP